MDFQWVAIALGDVVWVAAAFVLGMASRSVGLPPLVGFLATVAFARYVYRGALSERQGLSSGDLSAERLGSWKCDYDSGVDHFRRLVHAIASRLTCL